MGNRTYNFRKLNHQSIAEQDSPSAQKKFISISILKVVAILSFPYRRANVPFTRSSLALFSQHFNLNSYYISKAAKEHFFSSLLLSSLFMKPCHLFQTSYIKKKNNSVYTFR